MLRFPSNAESKRSDGGGCGRQPPFDSVLITFITSKSRNDSFFFLITLLFVFFSAAERSIITALLRKSLHFG